MNHNLDLDIKSPLHYLNIENILGPISLSEHISPKDGKHIYIFGDQHQFSEGCPLLKNSIRIDNYISQTLRYHPNKVIDIFLEVPYLTGQDLKVFNYDIDAGYLFVNTINTFSKCLQVVKKGCPFKNARFHYSDIRFHERYDFEGIMYQHEILELLLDILEEVFDEYDEGKINRRKKGEYASKIYSVLAMYHAKMTYFHFEPQNALNKTKLQKQLKNIKNTKAKEEIEKMIDYFYTHAKEVFNIDKTLKTLFLKFDKEEFLKKGVEAFENLTERLNKLYSTLGPIHSTVMDVYLLSRLFRSFKPKKKGQYSEEPKYIIIYVGNEHAEIYRKFFDRLGYKKVNEVNTEEGNQCLDISSFKRPFFSKEINLSKV